MIIIRERERGKKGTNSHSFIYYQLIKQSKKNQIKTRKLKCTYKLTPKKNLSKHFKLFVDVTSENA